MARSGNASVTSTFQKKTSTLDHSTSETSITTRDASGKDIGSVFFPSSLSPFSSRKSAACIVVKTMSELAISAAILDALTERSPAQHPSGEHGTMYPKKERETIPASCVAPNSKLAYPTALQALRITICPCRPRSLYAMVNKHIRILAGSTPRYIERRRHEAIRIHRRFLAWETVTRPAGIGRHGLFTASSPGLMH